MSATAEQIARLRRMVAEPSRDTYSDDVLAEYIEDHEVRDRYGEPPRTPLGVANSSWTATYDLNAAAADIWEEKASAWADAFDTSIDGASLSESEVYRQYLQMARRYRSRCRVRSAPMLSRRDEAMRHGLRQGEGADANDFFPDGLAE